jgi:hypothetical protein
MKKNTKSKKQVIVVPTTQKTILKTKPTKTLTKSYPIHSKPSKESTLAYYNCLIDKVANPSNKKVKITQLAHQCKCDKTEVAQAHQAHKKQLVKKVAQDYLTLGENLGHYLHADIVGCAKELKK